MLSQSKPLDISSLKEELGDILASAGELANARAAKVISLRGEQHTALDLRDFWTFFNVSWEFVVKTEVICRRMIVGLRGVVVSQVSGTPLHNFYPSLRLLAVEDVHPSLPSKSSLTIGQAGRGRAMEPCRG